MDGKKTKIQSRRLRFFRNKDYRVSEEILEHLEYQTGELLVVESITDIRRDRGTVELQVEWRGFTEDESDWVPISSLRKDVPELVNEHLEELLSRVTKRQRSVAASL